MVLRNRLYYRFHIANVLMADKRDGILGITLEKYINNVVKPETVNLHFSILLENFHVMGKAFF